MRHFFNLSRRYRVDSYMHRKVVDKRGAKDLYKTWTAIVIALAFSGLIIYCVFK